jgi:hypothetical protein
MNRNGGIHQAADPFHLPRGAHLGDANGIRRHPVNELDILFASLPQGVYPHHQLRIRFPGRGHKQGGQGAGLRLLLRGHTVLEIDDGQVGRQLIQLIQVFYPVGRHHQGAAAQSPDRRAGSHPIGQLLFYLFFPGLFQPGDVIKNHRTGRFVAINFLPHTWMPAFAGMTGILWRLFRHSGWSVAEIRNSAGIFLDSLLRSVNGASPHHSSGLCRDDGNSIYTRRMEGAPAHTPSNYSNVGAASAATKKPRGNLSRLLCPKGRRRSYRPECRSGFSRTAMVGKVPLKRDLQAQSPGRFEVYALPLNTANHFF